MGMKPFYLYDSLPPDNNKVIKNKHT